MHIPISHPTGVLCVSYELLNRLRTPQDLHNLTDAELERLCGEIRTFLVDHISRTGGHLASNLGIVELSVAIALEFDTARDRILYDVGHQSYVHKLLSGRRDGFDTLRSFGGMSGFPRPWESEHDAFVAGHASNSISAALGMARARRLMGDDYHIVPVIGDASLAGGMAMEALNDVGHTQEPLIVILNDNAMAISPSVGALAEHLSRIRLHPAYFRLKTQAHKLVSERFGAFLHRVKRRIKGLIIPGTFIENMGITYLGPVDGHDLPRLRQILRFAKEQTQPVLIHCITTKGKGYSHSENRPEKYHGIVEFDIESGKTLKKNKRGFSDTFGETLTSLAREDERICAVTAAMPAGTGLIGFSQTFPHRFFDVGIAEQHAVTMAAGMAHRGLRPVCAIYSTFLQRAYDQIIHDVAIDPHRLILAVDRAGLVGADGETHQGVFDATFLSSIPGMTLYSPASCDELSGILTRVLRTDGGPVAIRYPRGGDGLYTDDRSGTPVSVIRDGSDVTLVCYGIMVNQALKAAEALEKKGISARIVKLFTLKPLPDLQAAALCTDKIVLVEDCVPTGSIGTQLLAAFLRQGFVPRIAHLTTGEQFLPCGSVQELYDHCGIGADAIAGAAERLIHERSDV
ncbi:MAG: 1-deoxy-D-xylulose-5-phosphate synthase [Clostridia bacterium]|nr:1-deoxy-D-xylulose-5-phosphate synthase [Clostridia bacterium]